MRLVESVSIQSKQKWSEYGLKFKSQSKGIGWSVDRIRLGTDGLDRFEVKWIWSDWVETNIARSLGLGPD